MFDIHVYTVFACDILNQHSNMDVFQSTFYYARKATIMIIIIIIIINTLFSEGNSWSDTL